MKKFFIFIPFLFAAVGIYIGVTTQSIRTEHPLNVTTPQPTYQKADPSIFVIPKLTVHTEIEKVGVDAEGRMDIPKNWQHVAWYAPGVKPGETGSAVIDGHVDTPTGAPAVFANLTHLTKGDEIIIIDTANQKYTYKVTHVVTYPLENVPLTDVFSKTNGNHLNLITCGGIWDRNKHQYTERTVVYSDLSS